MGFSAWPFLAALMTSVAGREIAFPPRHSVGEQYIFSPGGNADVTSGSTFVGLTTYANLPYVHCLAGGGEEVEKYDIAILGAPFDTVS